MADILGSLEAAGRAEGEPTRPPAPELHKYFATCAPGLEDFLAQELRSPQIGATRVVPHSSGVHFVGSQEVGYRSNLWLRTAIRVLQLIHEGNLAPHLHGGDELYRITREAAHWPDLVNPRMTFSTHAVISSNTGVTSSRLVERRVKDAVCDALRDATGQKPEPPESRTLADLPLFMTVFRDRMTIYRDMSGVSLHRRGYRPDVIHVASLNECTAAAMLYAAGWDSLGPAGGVLADPMCGSGTILMEAALMAQNAAPGIGRPFWPFQTWKDYDSGMWVDILGEARDARHPMPSGGALLGNDIDARPVRLAKAAAETLGLSLDFRVGTAGTWGPKCDLVVTNPPWGERMLGEGPASPKRDGDGFYDEDEDASGRRMGGRGPQGAAPLSPELTETWEELRLMLRQRCAGKSACVLSGNPAATKILGMKASRKIPVGVGGIDCRMLTYEIRSAKQRRAAEQHRQENPRAKRGFGGDDFEYEVAAAAKPATVDPAEFKVTPFEG